MNATFNNISVISWCSVLLVEETRAPGENHQLHDQIMPSNYKVDLPVAADFSVASEVGLEGGFRGFWFSLFLSFQSVFGFGVELLLKYNVDLCQINTIGTL
jgi:hypothetical protein